jgi:curved DNA-binding protein
MSREPMEDYYEVLQVSPNADTETILKVFRHLAKRFHPDNAQSGDPIRFDLLVKAHRVLSNPEERAAYDAIHRQYWNDQWKLVGEAASAGDGFGDDRRVREHILSLFYVKKRRNLSDPGLGSMELCRLLDCPEEVIEFHIWYIREKGWIIRLETGMFAITADGVDQVEQNKLDFKPKRMLTSRSSQEDTDQDESFVATP